MNLMNRNKKLKKIQKVQMTVYLRIKKMLYHKVSLKTKMNYLNN